MSLQDLRVLVAAEKRPVRNLLKRLAQTEGGTSVVGEAENATGVLTLARGARPDVVLMDLYLPCGDLTSVNACGLNAAQELAAELSGVLVVLVTSPDENHFFRHSSIACLSREGIAGPVPCSLRETYHANRGKMPVFAGITESASVMANPDAVCRIAGTSALVIFFWPWVLIYLLVKAFEKITGMLRTRTHERKAVNEPRENTGVSSFLSD